MAGAALLSTSMADSARDSCHYCGCAGPTDRCSRGCARRSRRRRGRDGHRASKLRGATVVNSKNEKIGELDDLIVGKDRVLFGIIEVGGFLGIGSHLIAVPYSSLQISEEGKRIVLPGASKEHVKDLPEFKYR